MNEKAQKEASRFRLASFCAVWGGVETAVGIRV